MYYDQDYDDEDDEDDDEDDEDDEDEEDDEDNEYDDQDLCPGGQVHVPPGALQTPPCSQGGSQTTEK